MVVGEWLLKKEGKIKQTKMSALVCRQGPAQHYVVTEILGDLRKLVSALADPEECRAGYTDSQSSSFLSNFGVSSQRSQIYSSPDEQSGRSFGTPRGSLFRHIVP